MKLESQVCTEQQADRLKELGVLQESLFYHTHSDWGVMPKKSIDFSGNPSSAFTCAELGVMLDSANVDKSIRKGHKGEYYVSIHENGSYTYFKTEAEARAAKLIYNLEQQWLSAAEVNERLQNS